MATPFLGQIISVGFGFAPVGWYPCDGRLLDVSEYNALYALLGTTYGGNGQTTFALPNLNGRVPLGQGQGQGLSNYLQGQQVGTEEVSLTSGNTPSHTHTISFSPLDAVLDSPKPVSGSPVAVGANTNDALKGFYATGKTATIPLIPGMVTSTGSGLPHENRQQYLVLHYIIAYAGIYPSQG